MTSGSNRAADDLRQEVLGRIGESRELLAEACSELGNTYAPLGHEQPVADAVSAGTAGTTYRRSSRRSCLSDQTMN